MHLLDVNMLIALCDPMHTHRTIAKKWFQEQSTNGWATCPITENGLVRILGQPAYPNGPPTPSGPLQALRQLTSLPGHQFWNDNISISDPNLFEELTHLNSKQITDVYLLGLAASRTSKLVTLDKGIDSNRVQGGTEALIIVSD